jgi:hypothetical protein
MENKKLIDDFIKFYNKLKIKENKDNKNSNVIKLKEDKNHLCDFVLDDNNKIGKTYKNIYKEFINKQNKEIENILYLKIMAGTSDSKSIKRKNIQQIKEDEIFTLKVSKKFSFINVIFNSSFRKIIDNKNLEIFNQYEINFDSLEDILTDLLLNNKKLFNESINEFSYKNEIFSNEVNDLITSFKTNYSTTTIGLDDKEFIYIFIKDHEKNKILYKSMIDDFLTLLQYLNDLKKEDKEDIISKNSKISEVLEKINDNISKEFLSFFKEKNELTINKISEIFEYYLKLIYKDIKDQIKDYQENLEEKELEDKKKKLEEYYEKVSSFIGKDDFVSAIRLFITLVLFREEDKEKKIKSNRQNIVKYLKAQDLWNKNIYNNEKFNENLIEIKAINIQVNQILNIVDINEEDNSDVQEYIKTKYKPKLLEDSDLESDE